MRVEKVTRRGDAAGDRPAIASTTAASTRCGLMPASPPSKTHTGSRRLRPAVLPVRKDKQCCDHEQGPERRCRPRRWWGGSILATLQVAHRKRAHLLLTMCVHARILKWSMHRTTRPQAPQQRLSALLGERETSSRAPPLRNLPQQLGVCCGLPSDASASPLIINRSCAAKLRS